MSDGVTWLEDTTNCDGTDTTIKDNTECFIPMTTLKDTYGYTTYGVNVPVKVRAINGVDEGEYS